MVAAPVLGTGSARSGGSSPLPPTANMEEPEAYRINWIPFIHAKIWLDSKPLIPRTETEYWVNEVITKLRSSEAKKLSILDLCAGSGAIGVAVLQEIPEAHVDFAEKEIRHHKTIEKNVRENIKNPERRYRIIGGDLFENITDKYDAIMTNPPYIDPKKLGRVQESVLRYEPREALMGGKDGMEIIKRILEESLKHLSPGGLLYIEHEPEQREKIKQLANSLSPSTSLGASYSSCESLPDQFGTIRYSRLIC